MKTGKTFSGYYYGPDAEIKEYPRAVKCQGKCGYGYNCGTCRYRIVSTEDGAPQRCMCRKESE